MKKYLAKMKKNYYSPTPKKWRQIGDTLLAISLISVPVDLAGYKWIAISFFVMGILGKFLTNFFTEDEQNNQNGSSRD